MRIIASLQSRWQVIDAPAAATNVRQETSKSNGDQAPRPARTCARGEARADSSLTRHADLYCAEPVLSFHLGGGPGAADAYAERIRMTRGTRAKGKGSK